MKTLTVYFFYLKIFIIIFLLSDEIASCKKKKQTVKFSGVEVNFINPTSMNDFYRIYYSGDLVMYQSHHFFDSVHVQLKFDSISNVMSEDRVLIMQEKRKRFFVFHKDSLFGYQFGRYGDIYDNIPLNVDSMVRMISVGGDMDKFLVLKPDLTNWKADSTEVNRTYIIPASDTTPAIRIILYYSKKLAHINESFSRTLDSANKMKLYKTETKFDEFYNSKAMTTSPPITIVFEIREINAENPEEINKYFDAYIKLSGAKAPRSQSRN